MEMQMDVANPIPNICCSRLRFFVQFFCAWSESGQGHGQVRASQAWYILQQQISHSFLGRKARSRSKGQARHNTFCNSKFPLPSWVKKSGQGQGQVRSSQTWYICNSKFPLASQVMKCGQGQGEDHGQKFKLDLVYIIMKRIRE